MKERKSNHKHILALILTVALIAGLTIGAAATTSSNAWTVSDDTEIFWIETNDSKNTDTELAEQIQLFASEMAEKTGNNLSISYGKASKAGFDDILLELDSSYEYHPQGYNIKVDSNGVKVIASDADGLFYGCRELIKQLKVDGKVIATDESAGPDVAERGVSLDNGRKYYSVEWIKKFIREMSWANMNALTLHFTEEMGWGIESELYPWLAGRDGDLCTQAEVVTDNTVLTKGEVEEIVNYAKLYHIEIIPSMDSPGHLNYMVKKFNEQCAEKDFSFIYDGKTYTAKTGSEIGNYYHYNGQTSIVKGSRNAAYSRGIDISNEVAVAFMKSLIEEYGTFFNNLGCTKFDIGGDELLGWGSAITSSVSKWKQLDHWKEYAQDQTGNNNAVAYDAFLLYMNDLNDLVRSLGFTSVRMWNDDALRSSDTGWNGVVELDKDIDIWFWTTDSGNSVWTYAGADYQVYNILSDYNYYAMTNDYFSDSRGSFAQSYPDQIYNEWTPFTFDPTNTTLGEGKNTAIGNPNVLGSAFGIWSDNPTLRTEDQVMSDVLPMIRAHGAKAWDATANKTVAYSEFSSNLEALGDAPAGTGPAPEIGVVAGEEKRAELQKAIDTFNTVDSALYTEDSFAVYSAEVKKAVALLNDSKASVAEIDALLSSIQKAFEDLALSKENEILVAAAFKSAMTFNNRTKTVILTVKDQPVTNETTFTVTNKTNHNQEVQSLTPSNISTGDGVTYVQLNVKVLGAGKTIYEIAGFEEATTASITVATAAN